MSYSVHLLNQTYMEEQDLAVNMEKAAKNLNLNFALENEEIMKYTVSNPQTFATLEIYINTKEKFNYAINNEYYPKITGYGPNIIIGYGYGGKDEILIPFLREFLKDYTEVVVYVGENLPSEVDYYVYTKDDIDSFTTTNEYAFTDHPPKDMGNYA
ncbi:MAG: hypothetical protein JWN78_397 [Bacteroidota bacterium]|nr:hypothetical protein [Bacteroidota bacterium]